MAAPTRCRGEPTEPYMPTFTGELPAQPDPVQPLAAETEPPSEPLPAPVQPVVVPSAYQYLKRWTFVLVVSGVWIFGAAVGAGHLLLVVPLRRQDACGVRGARSLSWSARSAAC